MRCLVHVPAKHRHDSDAPCLQLSEFVDNSIKALHGGQSSHPEINMHFVYDRSVECGPPDDPGSKRLSCLVTFDNGCGMPVSALRSWSHRGGVPKRQAAVRKEQELPPCCFVSDMSLQHLPCLPYKTSASTTMST